MPLKDVKQIFASLINDAVHQNINSKTLETFETLFEHHMAESWGVGHHQNTILQIQEVLNNFKVKLDECGLEINESDHFLCNNNKKTLYLNMWKDVNWMDYNDWHKLNIKMNKRMKEMNKNDEFKLVINNILWVSHCRGAHMSPDTILRNNPETLHARMIFQFCYHHLFFCYAGADCNGDTPGNSVNKTNKFLDSMTQKNYRNRNLLYTQGLKWNHTLLTMTTNNQDVNAGLRNAETGEISFTCAAMCGLYAAAFIFSVIYNRKTLKEIQKEIVSIIKKHDGLDKELLKGDRKKKLHKLRRTGNQIIQATAHRMMDHIVPRTQTIINMVTPSMSTFKAKIQAGVKNGTATTSSTVNRNDSKSMEPRESIARKMLRDRMRARRKEKIANMNKKRKIGRGNKRKFDEINDFQVNCNNCDSKKQRIN